MTTDKMEIEFLLEEYKQGWKYIQFHYEQRDKSLRFFITLIVGIGSIILAINEIFGVEILKTVSPELFLIVLVPLFLVGIFIVAQIISLRKTTTLYQKVIVTIRAQLIEDLYTPLWINDNQPKFYNPGGFNFFYATIPIIINSFIFAGIVYSLVVAIINNDLIIVILALSALLMTLAQLFWYRSALRREDNSYEPIFPEKVGNSQ